MKQTVNTFIAKKHLLAYGDKVIVALSGGPDSVALLHILLSLHYTCIAAHCNFHLRGQESNRDENFSVDLCAKLQVPIVVTHFDTTAYAKSHKVSIEMAARELRYAWFNELLCTHNAQAIAVAHHADDQAETVLMNMVRGAGLRGLCGMAAKNGNIIRPLLCCTRRDIENYLTVQKLDYVIDHTNNETIYKRNKFRHKVIPLLEEINPNVRNTLFENSKHFEGYLKMIYSQVEEIHNKITHTENGNLYIDIEMLKLQAAPETVLYEILLPYNFGAAQTEQLYAATESTSGKQFQTNTHTAVKDRQNIIVYPNEVCACIPTISTTTRAKKEKENFPPADADIAFFDADKLQEPLTLRHWQQGDTFRPIGLKGNKKLSDFFTDIKLDIHQKQEIWLLISGDKIAWVSGYRVSDDFKITAHTQNVIEVSINEKPLT